MDTAVLVRTEMSAAWKLIEALKEKNFPMAAAFWHYLPDTEVWRLVIATALVDQAGSIAAYTELQSQLNRLPEEISEGFSVANITLLSSAAEQLTKLRKRYGNVPFDKSYIRRVSLSPEEAYIYFL